MRAWRICALAIALATAILFLGTPLVFAPVPWPDGSAFFLPGLELLHWPPQWRMHAQAAFVPTYDLANFNIPPGLPLLLALAAHSGLLKIMGAPLMIKAVTLTSVFLWAWLLGEWLIEALSPHVSARRARWLASLIALAGLWDPVIRWGTLAVRTEAWIGLGWLWIVRELLRFERGQKWTRTAWSISGALALLAYFHYEAVYLVPAVIVGLGFQKGWFKRLLGIGFRTAALFSPWLLYAVLHFSLFLEQMKIQFSRLSVVNIWMRNAYVTFHSLFIEHGSPSGYPPFFNTAKAAFWTLLAFCSLLTLGVALKNLLKRRPLPPPGRTLLACGVAFFACFYLWYTKAEIWFITLCHVTLWPWVGAALIELLSRPKPARRRIAALAALTTVFVVFAFGATLKQSRTISPQYTWAVYGQWVDCIERAAAPASSRPHFKFWQPSLPDVLVEFSQRHPDWDGTRSLDFLERTNEALHTVRQMDALIFTRHFNPPRNKPVPSYEGIMRPDDRLKLSQGEDIPFGPWALDTLPKIDPGLWAMKVCEVGPFWATVAMRKLPPLPVDPESSDQSFRR
jgi:hypothetical protein